MFDGSIDLPAGLDPAQRAEVQRFARLLATPADPDNGAAMARWQQDRARAQAVLDGASLTATAAFESSLVWAADGAKSAGAWLAANTSCSRVAANVRLKTARLARTMPHLSAAAQRGDLCADKVHHLARARTAETAEAFERDEAQLVRQLVPLQVEAARAHLLAWRLRVLEEAGRNEPDGPTPGPDTDADHLNLSGGFGGRGLIQGDLTPESRALVFGGIESEIDRWFREGALTEDGRSRGELQGRALVELVRRGLDRTDQHGAPRPLVMALADATTLAGTEPAPGPRPSGSPAASPDRRCEIIGVGPVPAAVVQRLLCDADVVRVVTDGRGQPIDVGRAERLFTPAQWRVMIVASGGGCEFPGCDVPHERCQAHHLLPWDAGGRTDLANGMLVCHLHHHLLHEGRFTARRTAAGLEVRRPDGTVVRTAYRRAS